jgi:hypothetical protein
MFEFLFGGKKKLELIRELLEQRMRDHGFNDMEYRIKVKEMSNFQLMGTPEGAIVTIIENVFKMQKQGLLLGQIFLSIEEHRKTLGQDVKEFNEILKIARGNSAGDAVPMYTFYRLNVEAPGKVTEEQFINAFSQATNFLANQ